MGEPRPPTNPSIDPDPRPPQPPATEPGHPPEDPRAAGPPPEAEPEQEASKSDRARERASDVAEATRRHTGRVTDEAASQGRRVMNDATGQLRRQADAKTHGLASSLYQLGEEGHALVDGRPDDAPQAQRYLREAADAVGRAGERIDELGLDGMVDEVGRVARRRPAMFLLGATAAGFVVGRALRNAGGAEPRPSRQTGDGEHRSPSSGEPGSRPGTAEPSVTPPPPEPGARPRSAGEPGPEAADPARSRSSDTDVLP